MNVHLERERFIQQNQTVCVSLLLRAFKNFEMCVLSKSHAIDPPNPAREFIQQHENVHLQNVKKRVSLELRRSAHRILREGSSSKMIMCVSLQRRAFQNLEMCVSLQRRTKNCVKQVIDVRGSSQHTKIVVVLDFLLPQSDKRVA